MRKRIGKRWVVLAVFGVLFVVLFAIVGIAVGIGHPSVPSGAVAVVQDVPDGTVTTQDFDASFKQQAFRQGLPSPPKPSSPQYQSLHDQAVSDVLSRVWIRGEAAERGIVISDTEISNQLQQIIKQQFHTQKAFQQFLKQAGYTPQQARDQVELSLLQDQIKKEVAPTTATVSDSDVSNFYEANKSQFSQPETRDVRQIVNKDQAKVEQAKAILAKDDSAKSWKQVAAKYSTDAATQSTGGLRAGVTSGQSDPVVDQAIFAAAQGTLIGPIKSQSGGYYLIEVDKVTPAATTPLSKVAAQIKQQLDQGLQQQLGTEFQTDFVNKWTQRTFCADGYVINQCDNYTPKPAAVAGAAPVTPTPAVDPGSAAVFPGLPIPALPQRPCGFEDSTVTPPVACNWPTTAPKQQAPGVIGPSGAPTLPQQGGSTTAPPATTPGG